MPVPIDRSSNISDALGFAFPNIALEDLEEHVHLAHSPLARDFHKPLWDQLLWLTDQINQRRGSLNLAPQNFLINPSMRLMQRYDPTTGSYQTITADACGFDRWKCSRENASLQAIRVDTNGAIETGLSGRYYASYKKLTSAGKIFVRQILPGTDTAALRNRHVTFQVALKSDANRIIRIGILELQAAGTIDTVPATPSAWGANTVNPTFGTNVANIDPEAVVNATIDAYGAACAVTTVWQTFAVSCQIPINSKNIILGIWSDSQVAANGLLKVSQAILSDGLGAKDFLPEDQSLDEQRAKRYFTKTYDIDMLPGTNISAGALQYLCAVAGVKQQGAHLRFAAAMRASPTITLFNPGGGATGKWRNITQGADSGTATDNATNPVATTLLNPQVAGEAQGDILAIHATFDAEL